MPKQLIVHYDNEVGFPHPLLEWTGEQKESLQPVERSDQDEFGAVFRLETDRAEFEFVIRDAKSTMREEPSAQRRMRSDMWRKDGPTEVWCHARSPFVYLVPPRPPEVMSAGRFLSQLKYKPGMHIPSTGGLAGLGAHVLADGRVLFGLYHPTAARVYLKGTFNDWQGPDGRPEEVIELKRYRGWFNVPNTWLTVVDGAKAGDEYRFVVVGGVPSNGGTYRMEVADPLCRRLGADAKVNHGEIVDPTTYEWHDADWQTPLPSDLIVYELSVYGLTAPDDSLPRSKQGTFNGVRDFVEDEYFQKLGANALAMLPITEVPTQMGPEALGYNPVLHLTIERDYGTPDELRALVDAAHQRGLAVILDKVFNHTSNRQNLLWQNVLEHPNQEEENNGGLYFAGQTPWGNRFATNKADVQNILVDICKTWLTEYHVDGFRFDATSSNYMDHGTPIRIGRELRQLKPDVILIAENLPNERDLNFEGFNGYLQWCAPFHHKMKALLREGQFESWDYEDLSDLAEIFYFCKGVFAAHTNNVLNYTWSHDEHSPVHEVRSNEALDNPAALERKGRLALFATTVALGQPMYFMGQEFNVDRARNVAWMEWPENYEEHAFYQYTRGMLHLRQRYPGLRIAGYDPVSEGTFDWILGHWLPKEQARGSKVIGWRATPTDQAEETLVVMLNFENHEVTVDVPFGIPGTWVCLADMDEVNDLPPAGDNGADHPKALTTEDGWFRGFSLPSSSGFLYKWVSPLADGDAEEA